VAIGLPVVVATVHGRTVWAQTNGSTNGTGISPAPSGTLTEPTETQTP
jgi:hypothetical protein